MNSLDGCHKLESIIIRAPEDGVLERVAVSTINETNNTFYIYVPSAYYDSIISNLTGSVVPASRYRKLEDYPEIDNWNAS
jgi:hypothetical protein